MTGREWGNLARRIALVFVAFEILSMFLVCFASFANGWPWYACGVAVVGTHVFVRFVQRRTIRRLCRFAIIRELRRGGPW